MQRFVLTILFIALSDSLHASGDIVFYQKAWKALMEKKPFNNPLAWEGWPHEDGIVIRVQERLGKRGKKTILQSYICHFFEENVQCEQSLEGPQIPQTEIFQEMESAHEAALLKIATMLKIKKESFIFEKIKVWRQSPPHSDHHRSGMEIWVQISLNSNGEKLLVSLYCHPHEDNNLTYYCHYDSDPPKGPAFPKERQ